MAMHIPLEQAVTEFYEIYRKDKVAARSLVKEYCRHFDLNQIDLILENLRTMARGYAEEARMVSPVKISIFLLIALGFAANGLRFEHNIIVYLILCLASIVPFWDSSSYSKKSYGYSIFADVVESEASVFRDVCKHKNERDLDSLLGIENPSSSAFS